jgi:hypothetical protein
VREVLLSGTLASGGRWFYRRGRSEKNAAGACPAGIADLESHSYQALSGGQRLRVLLARALCAAVDLLLLERTHRRADPEALRRCIRRFCSSTAQGDAHQRIARSFGALASATHVLQSGHHSGWFARRAIPAPILGRKERRRYDPCANVSRSLSVPGHRRALWSAYWLRFARRFWGVSLVLRRFSMIGDGLSHVALADGGRHRVA